MSSNSSAHSGDEESKRDHDSIMKHSKSRNVAWVDASNPFNDATFQYHLTFNSEEIRSRFVRKVFVLVTVMLTVVAVICALPFLLPQLRQVVRSNPELLLLSVLCYLATAIPILCCPSVGRTFPINLIFTTIVTLSMGFMTMVFCALYTLESVLMCVIITAISCACIILFASTTNKDLTSCLGVAFILGMVVCVLGIIGCIATLFFHIRIIYIIYAGLTSLVFMFYLAIDIQLIMGGRHIEISPKDYILAAVMLFVDIINIFWHLLILFGRPE